MKKENKLLKYLFVLAGGFLSLCVLLVIGGLVLDALGLSPEDTPTSQPTAISQAEVSIKPTSTNEPTFIPLPTETALPTPTTAVLEVSQETEVPDCVQENTKQELGKVVGVVDGDTIDVLLEDGQTYRVRYIGMDTPENGDLYFEEATSKNRELVEGKAITLVKDVS